MNYFKKANELYNAKEYQKAISMYERALKVNENESSSLYNTAVCHIKLKNYKKAVGLLKNAINLKRDSKYIFNLGYCYAMLNDNPKALYHFNLAWSINNDDKDCEKAINLILDNYID